MSDMGFIAAMERQADTEIAQKIQRAVHAERERCLEDNCNNCLSHLPIVRMNAQEWVHPFSIGETEYHERCPMSNTHERLHQGQVKNGTD